MRGVPERHFDAEGLLAVIEKEFSPAGRRFLVPRAAAAREVLPENLQRAGATVECVTVYRSAPPDVDPEAIRAPLVAGEIQALTFTSPLTVANFTALLDTAARSAAARCWIASIGPVTTEALRREGLEPDVMPERADTADLVAALAAHFSKHGPKEHQ